jgi:hypothetical protein
MKTNYENYTVEPQVGKRMVGGVLDGTPMHEVEYTTFRILRDGQLVGLVYDQADVQIAIETMEKYPHAGRTMNNRFD